MSTAKKRTLREFASAQRKTTCPICKLPTALREEVKTASRRGIVNATVASWLKAEHNIRVTAHQIQAHGRGRHDEA